MIEKIITGVVVLVILYLLYVMLKYFKFFENRHLTSQMSAKDNKYEIPFDDWCPSGAPSANFAMSIWFYVSSWDTSATKNIFLRNNSDSTSDPEIHAYLADNNNDLVVKFSDGETTPSLTTCEIKNIPLQKWIHLAVSKYNSVLDIYIDGKLIKSCASSSSISPIPASVGILLHSDQTGEDAGFDGYTTHVKYFNSAISPTAVYNIYKNGYGGSFLDSLLGGYRMRMSLFRNDEEIAGVGLG